MPPKRRAAAARTTASKARSSKAKAAPQRRTTTTKEEVKQVKTKQQQPMTRKRPRSDSQHVKPKQRTRRSSKHEDTNKSPAVAVLCDTRSEDSPARLTASRETRQSIHAWQHSLSESAPHTAACTQSVKENMSEAVDVAKQLFASHSPTRVNEEENSKSSSSETVFIAEKQSSEGKAEATVQQGNTHYNTSYTEESDGGDIELVLHSLTSSSSSSSSSLDTAELFSLSSVEPNSRRTTVQHTQNEEEEEHNNENRSGNTTNGMMTSCMTARSSATQAALSAPSPSLSTQPLHEAGHEIHTPLNTACNAALQMNQDLLRAHFLQSSPGHLRLDGSGRKENTLLLEQQESAQQRCFPSQPPPSLQTHTTAAAHVRHSSLQSNPNTAESGTSHVIDGAALGHTLPSKDSASRPSTQLITRAAAMRPLVSPGTMWICLDDDDEDATEPTSPSSPTLRNVLLTPATQQQQQKSTPVSSTSNGGVFAKAYNSIQTVNRTIQNGDKYATQPVRPFFQPQALQSMGRLSTEQGRSVSQEVRQSKEPIGTMLWPTFRPRRAIPPSLVATQGDRARHILAVHAASKLRLPEHGYIRMDDDDDEDEGGKKGAQGNKTATPQLLPFIKDDDHTDSSRTSVTTSSEEDEERTASPHSSGSRTNTTTTTSTSSSSFTTSGSTSSTTMKTRSQTSSAAPLSSPNRSVIDFLFSARPTHIAHSEGDHETSERDKQAGRRTSKQKQNRDSVQSSKKDRLGWGRPVDDLLRLFPQRYTKASFRSAAADVIPAAHFLSANEFWSAFASATYVGEGSFGLVWRCVTVAGDAVAVKSCPVSLRSRGSIEDGFATVREIATMRFLSEQQVPYVLPLHSAFYVTGQEALPPQIVRVLEWRRAQRAAAEAAVVARRVTALSRGGRTSARSKRTAAAVAKTTKSKQSEEDEKDFESAVQAELRRMEANESAQERAVRAEMQAVALPRFFSIREDEVRDCEVTIFLVTELCDGDVESIPRNDAVTKGVAYCVSSALAAMHELGLLHLDLKPSNILFAYERSPTQGHTNTNATSSNGNEWGSRYDSPPLDITTLTSVTPPTERTPPTARLSSAEPVILAERVEVTSSAAAQCVSSDVSMKAGAAEGGGAGATSNGINMMKETMPSAAVCKDEQTYHVDQLSPCRDVNEEMGKRASVHGLTATSRTDVCTASLTPSQPRSQRETTASTGQPSAPPAIKFYLSDFGNCRVVGPSMSDIVKDVYGTFEYMDLRALRDEVCSRATDSFSLGCTLYEMLYGRRVYPHCTNPKCLNEEDHTRLCFVEAAKRPVVMPIPLSNPITQSEHHTQECEMKSETAVGKIPLTTLQKVTAALLLHDPQQRMTAAQCHAHLAKAYHVTQALRHPSTT